MWREKQSRMALAEWLIATAHARNPQRQAAPTRPDRAGQAERQIQLLRRFLVATGAGRRALPQDGRLC